MANPSANIPTPAPMKTEGWPVVAESCQFFFEQWKNCEIATTLNTGDSKVRIASILSVLGNDAFRIYQHTYLARANKNLTRVLKNT